MRWSSIAPLVVFSEKVVQMFFKIGALKIFINFTRKQPCWSLFLINFIKITPTQVASWEICKSFKKILFIEHLLWRLFLHSLRTLSILVMRILILVLILRLYVAAAYLFLNCNFILVCRMSFSNWWDTYINYFRELKRNSVFSLLVMSAIMKNSRQCTN